DTGADVIATGTGNIFMSGLGGLATTCHGINLSTSGSTVISGGGTITFFGTSQGTSTTNTCVGIQLVAGTNVTTSGSGNIFFTGLSGTGTTFNDGILITGT